MNLIVQQVLFESEPSDEERLNALEKVVVSEEVHETISRAWSLHLRHERESNAAILLKKYNSMRLAIDKLETVDPVLFELAIGGKKFQNVQQANQTNARLEGIVPRELRVPMERPGTNMWDATWTAPKAE